MINEQVKTGFTYLVEVVRKVDGKVVDSEMIHNIMPIEGLNHMLATTLLAGSQVPQWFLGLYENAYTPQSSDTMATFPSTAGESTAYVSTTRMSFLPGAASGGVVDNTANVAEFEFTASKTIAGGFMSSTNTKGGTGGVLLSAVRFSSPKVVEDDFILRVTAGIQLISS